MNNIYYYITDIPAQSDRQVNDVPLCVNCAGIVDDDSFFSNNSSRRDYYFLYLQKGRLNTGDGVLFSGDFIIFEPNYTYSYQGEGETSYLFVHFSGSEAKELIQSKGLPFATPMHIGIHTSIKSRFEYLFQEFMILDLESPQIMTALLNEIIALTSRYIKGTSMKKIPLKSIQYINFHYTENLTVKQLADIENMSLTKYRQLFKKHTGVSPLDYIITRRINAACRMLETSNCSISEIAAKSGFSDPYYFSRIFKKKMGISPHKYRKTETY